MTEDEYDEANDICSVVQDKIHELLENYLEDVSPEFDEYVRVKLTENVRFW